MEISGECIVMSEISCEGCRSRGPHVEDRDTGSDCAEIYEKIEEREDPLLQDNPSVDILPCLGLLWYDCRNE